MSTRLLCAATAFLLAGSAAYAYTTASGTLSISGQVESSLVLVLYTNAHGATLTGSGSPAASMTFGTVSKYGTQAGPIGGSNIVKSEQSDGFTLSTLVDVQVDKANLGSAAYSLSAQLQQTDNNTWTLGGTTLNPGSPVQLTTGGSYGQRTGLSLAIKFPAMATVGAVSNTITFTATAN